MRKIIYTRPDGGLSVMHPVMNTRGEAADFTEADAEQRAWDRLPLDAINPRFVDEGEIPTDRTFRNAWTHGGDKIDIDMAKAVEIQKGKLRELRAPLFIQNDIAIQDALVSGDKGALSVAVARRDSLRDVTVDPAIAAATTPDELAVVIPDSLK